MGETNAVFQADGSVPVSSDWVSMASNTGAKVVESSFSMQQGTWSGPQPCWGLFLSDKLLDSLNTDQQPVDRWVSGSG